MAARLNVQPNPEVNTAVGHLLKAIEAGGVDGRLLELVHLRGSQINGCGPCVFGGVYSAKKHGETDERLHNVVAWRETDLYTDAERAALALAEAATRIQDNATGVSDDVWAEAAKHFDDQQLYAIVLHIAMTNFFNRINHTLRNQAGATW